MRTAVHGMPRIGKDRALKWALEGFWAGRIGAEELEMQAATIRRRNWETMAEAGIDFVPSNDFSLYDHVLDAALAVGAVPERFRHVDGMLDLARYFAMARGGELGRGPVKPLDLTKWYDTNYHHLVAEIESTTVFHADATKPCTELSESAALGVPTTPVLLGPLTFLLRSTPTRTGADIGKVLDRLVETYAEVLGELGRQGAAWVRFDEPALVEDRSDEEFEALRRDYRRLAEIGPRPNIVISTYFGDIGPAMALIEDLPIEGVGLDFCRGPANLDLLLEIGGMRTKVLLAGVVDGRQVWVNDLEQSLALLERLSGLCAEVVVSTSCSLMHVPLSLTTETAIDPEIHPWLAFAEEKLGELAILARGSSQGRASISTEIQANQAVREIRNRSPLVTNPAVRRALSEAPTDPRRSSTPEERSNAQRSRLGLPVLPTTTIGSFPQTAELRAARALWRAGRTTNEQYENSLREEIDRVVALQEELGLDVLVHGEPERDDMVRYFAAQLTGFALPEEGWVQSYGSRCVRPPVLFGDISRPSRMTLEWVGYAQSLTSKPVKGMLTGPITMLRWSFVRDDQPESETAAQLGLAIRDELLDLQLAGAAIVQVDEPALREGLPLRLVDQAAYIAWATRAFRLVTAAAAADTQIHTHMCYAQLDDIVDVLEQLDVDVVSLEAARSHMSFVSNLQTASYRGGVGPGVYDVHSPICPEVFEIEELVRRALELLGPHRLWVNPDCGLKTRSYGEVSAVLADMVAAARIVRSDLIAGGPAVPAPVSGSFERRSP